MWSPRGYVDRIDMQTMKVLSVKMVNNSSVNIGGEATISNDGRWIAAVTNTQSNGQFVVADTSSCAGGETNYIIVDGIECQRKDLKPFLVNKIGRAHV